MISETISSVAFVINTTWNYLSVDLVNRGVNIVKAPFINQDMLWMLLPLLATLILMEFYLGRYKEEDIGWSEALGNALVLVFVSIDLFRHLY